MKDVVGNILKKKQRKVDKSDKAKEDAIIEDLIAKKRNSFNSFKDTDEEKDYKDYTKEDSIKKSDVKKDDAVKKEIKKEKIKKDISQMNVWSEFETTDEINIPKKIIDQVIGQEKAVEIIKKAAEQRRHVLLIGQPGTGKSMLAKAMAELLPYEDLEDILVERNPDDENNPKIRVVKAGEGREIVKKAIENELSKGINESNNKVPFIILVFFVLPMAFYFYAAVNNIQIDSMIIFGMMGFGILFLFFFGFNFRMLVGGGMKTSAPRIIVDNKDKKEAPFYDATGAHSGSLLGDVKHDPLQSGGLGTPPHLRVMAGLIHKSNKGVLFIDEVATLGKYQQDLLTAMQEKKLSITGRSEMSSGAMVMTDPVPCDFILIAAGNIHDIEHMHPALRSRIRGYGYEVYLDDVTEDSEENKKKIVQFVAQEVEKDGKIPHFTRDAVDEIICEAKRKAGMKGKLTLRFRELGGLVRSAGDIAVKKNHPYVLREDVIEGKKSARTLEQQIGDIYLNRKKEYNVLITTGSRVGRVNGLAVIGDGGTVLPIVAEVSPTSHAHDGQIIATGKLGEIAKEAVINVSAIIKNFIGQDISNHDIHIQFLQTYEGVEGDSASVSVAIAVLSAIENIGVKQDVAMTGSLTVRGDVLPVGGVTQKIEAAIEAGIKKVIIPKSNEKDVLLEKRYEGAIEIICAETIVDVLKNSLDNGKEVIKKMSKLINKS